jgi:hypothetical protein
MFKNMKDNKTISVIGVAWLLLWLSHIPHLIYYYPFQELKGVKSLTEEVTNIPEELKKLSGLGNKSQKELEESMTRELKILWVESLSIVLVGLLTAFLILKKRKSGYILALAFASGMLLLKLSPFLTKWHYLIAPQYWATLFKYFPAQTSLNLVSIIILGTSLVILLRPTVAAQFGKKK